MTVDQVIAFFLFSVAAAVTPGPSNAMILATGAQVGALRGLPCALGSATGMGSLLFASGLGLGQLILAAPALLKLLNAAGAAFLLWLAWKVASAGSASEMKARKPVGFLEAALFQWMNPKGWLVAVSAAGTFLQTASTNTVVQALTFGAIFFAAALPCGLIWLVAGGALHHVLRNEHHARIFNIGMGLALAASVVLMFR